MIMTINGDDNINNYIKHVITFNEHMLIMFISYFSHLIRNKIVAILRHFQIKFLEFKQLYFDQNWLNVFRRGPTDNKPASV